MEFNAKLYREAADAIDKLDEEIKDVNTCKKDIFGSVRDRAPPEEFRAFREAIKLRRARRADKDAVERHDGRVWALLIVLEGSEVPDEAETPPAPSPAPAGRIVAEEAPTRAGAHAHDAREELPPHDAETGEIAEEFPDIPPAFDRRRKLEAAE